MYQFFIVFVGVFLSGQGAGQFFMYSTSKLAFICLLHNQLLIIGNRYYQSSLRRQLHYLVEGASTHCGGDNFKSK